MKRLLYPELLGLAVAASWILVGPPVSLSPDGIEMIALAECGLGGPCDALSPGYWPPLWPALMVPGVVLGMPEAYGRVLNLLLAAAVTPLLWRLLGRLSQRAPRRPRAATLFAALVWAGLPVVRHQAVVLDARPLGWLLFALFAWGVLRGSRGERPRDWWLALLAAGLAPLARPEGIVLPVVLVVMLVSLRGRAGLRLAALLGGLALLPKAVWSAAVAGERHAVEAFFGPWIGSWPVPDLLALYGPAGLPTRYRGFAMELLASGQLAPPRDFLGLALASGQGLLQLPFALAAAAGVVLPVVALYGGVLAARRSRLGLVVLGLGLGLVLAVGAAPMASGQSSPAANFVFLVPMLLLGAGFAVVERPVGQRQPWAAVLGLLILADAHLGPARHAPPVHVEGSPAGLLAAAVLAETDTGGHPVYAGFEGRGILRRAGKRPQLLPSIWERWEPEHGAWAMLVDQGLVEAGRSLELVEDPDWRVCWIIEGEGMAQLERPLEQRAPDQGWVALLRYRESCEEADAL